ncbi:hypothetical protein BG842_09890 [Haladaptatus sp. W1]|nr:hypothetical protein BG842_09890 [Haladaptatus sp. W1]
MHPYVYIGNFMFNTDLVCIGYARVHSEAVTAALSSIPDHQYTHLATATRTPPTHWRLWCDIAAFGPG